MPVLIDHLERRLGRLTSGWRGEAREGLPAVNIACFTGGAFANTTGYATVGLSRVPLHHHAHEGHFFLEFIAAEHGPESVSRSFLPVALEFAASRCLNGREVVLRGDLIRLPDEIVDGTPFASLYAALPVYYDSDFKSVVVESGDAVAIAWLVPITSSEAQFVADYGWVSFEELLQAHDPDLMDLNRPAIA